MRYRPLVAESGAGGGGEDSDDEGAAAEDKDVQRGILDALDELERESSGDVLVFLSGESEIRDAEAAVRAHATRRGGAGETEVLPLYGRLSSADQHRVFEPSKVAGLRRRVVLATNVAETSLTVPGIRYVVDAGTARISRYSVRSKVQRLPIEAISQASANQRSGRSGRTSDGIAIRLYSEEDYERRPEFTDPEILRTNLAAVILQMASLGLGQIEEFPFLTPPDSRGIRDGLDLLRELGALDDGAAGDGPQLTRVGRQLARLPIEPRFARMVLESKAQGVSREVLAIVAGLTIQDPRERPLERREQADGFHARFVDPTSDFLTLLNLWNHLEEQQRQLSGSAFRRMCKAEFLNYLRVREWQDLYRQLVRLAKPLGLHVAERAGEPNADGIHRALLAGLLSQIGLRDDAKTSSGRGGAGSARETERRGRRQQAEFVGARNTRFVVFPGSALAKKPPAALMSAELVETSRLFARTNARHRSRLGRAARRPARQAHLQRAAVGASAGLGGRRREGHAVRRADRGEAAHPARPGRPGARARALHPARARRGGLGHEQPRPPAVRVRAGEPRAAPRARRGRGAHASSRHPRGRRGRRGVLRGAGAGGCRGHASLRALVARRASSTPRPPHDDARRPARRRGRRRARRRIPRPLAAGRPDVLARVPLRARRRRRRRDA